MGREGAKSVLCRHLMSCEGLWAPMENENEIIASESKKVVAEVYEVFAHPYFTAL